MSKLYGCMIAYNEESLIGGALRSLQNKVDEIIVVDGRIEEFPGYGAISTDATADIAQEYGARVIQIDAPYPTEQAMRSQYLVGVPGDWYFVLDADEVLMTKLPDTNTLTEPAYRIREEFLGGGPTIHPMRLFKHRGQMEYKRIHDGLHSDGVCITDAPELDNVWILHRQGQRSKERLTLKRTKRRICSTREHDIRIELGMGAAKWRNVKANK